MQKNKIKSPQPPGKLSRRLFITGTAAAAAVMAISPGTARAGKSSKEKNPPGFKLKYAPSLGMFKNHAGKDPIDQLKFMSDQGFSAMFDNGLMNRPKTQQKAIAREMERLNMTLGPFVAYADFSVKSFVTRDKDIRLMLKAKAKDAVENAGSMPSGRLWCRAALTRAWNGIIRLPM